MERCEVFSSRLLLAANVTFFFGLAFSKLQRDWLKLRVYAKLRKSSSFAVQQQQLATSIQQSA